MDIGNRINKIFNEEIFGIHFLDVSSMAEKKQYLKNIEKRIISAGAICHIAFMEEDNVLKIVYIDVHNVINEIVDKVLSLTNTYKDYTVLDDIVPLQTIQNYEITEYIDLFENFIKRIFRNKRIDGYYYAVNNDKSLNRSTGYDYIVEIFSKRNKPYVKFKAPFENNVNRFFLNYKKGVVYTETEIVFPYKYFSSFLESNKIDYKKIIVSKESIACFYSIDNTICEKYFVNLTENIVEEWWSEDCPKLYKHYPNIEDSSNAWGMHMNVFVNTLVDWGFNYTDVDEDITLYEVETLSKNHENTDIANHIKLTYETNRLSKEEKQTILNTIEKYEENVNLAITSIMEKVLEETCIELIGKSKYQLEYKELDCLGKYDDKVSILRNILYKNEPIMLDCGFVYFYPKDIKRNKELINNYIRIKGFGDKNRPWDSVKVPDIWGGQSTTIKEMIARKVVDKLKEVGIDLTYRIVLD